MRGYVWAAFLLFRVAVEARAPVCIDAVEAAINGLPFKESPLLDRLTARCQGRRRMHSFYASTTIYCKPADVGKGLEILAADCDARNTTLIPISEFESDLTDGAIHQLRVVDRFEFGLNDTLSEPVLLSSEFFDLAYRTIVTWRYESNLHISYGLASYAFWGVVIAAGTFSNFLTKYWERRIRHAADHVDMEDQKSTPSNLCRVFGRLEQCVKMYLTLPAGWKNYHLRLYHWCTVPTRGESIVVFGFWAMSIALSSTNYPTFYGNLHWPLPGRQLGRYLADRTGTLAYANLLILWLFSGRNNVLLWATGWNFARFNIYHRHVARVATLQAVAHSIAYHQLIMLNSGMRLYKLWLQEPWFFLGIVATVLMAVLPMFSSVFLRMFYYEAFLLIHIAFSVVILYSLFVHTSIFGGAYDIFLWPVVVVWGLDRSLRLVRLAYCNIRISFRDLKHPISTTQATVTYLTASNVLRVTIDPGLVPLKPKPGAHYYVYGAWNRFGWRLWENHPFTVASWGSTPPTSRPVPSSLDDPNPPRKRTSPSRPRYSSTDSNTPMLTDDSDESPALVFYIRPFHGFTKRLRDTCLHAPTHRATVPLLLEGPYGPSPPLANFETLVLLAGGTGIAGALPYLREHVHASGARTSRRTRFVRLVWTTQQAAFVRAVAARELRCAFGRGDVDMAFYATAPCHEGTEGDESARPLVEDAGPEELRIEHRRPDVAGEIRAAVREHRASERGAGRVAVLVCGPAGMADTARTTVVEIMREGFRQVEYFEDSYGW